MMVMVIDMVLLPMSLLCMCMQGVRCGGAVAGI